ncbi:MAG: ribonuclease HII, partial [bacterium]|nr:ribonuclease HII [bacterium]
IKNNFEYKCSMVSSRVIDKIGIQKATKLAVTRVLKKLSKKPDLVLLDGALFAPKNYNQQTIIRGDEKVPLISAASIVAKVSRDKKMRRLHKFYPQYQFEKHKGYGTKLHYKMIKKNGISPEHRKSYLKRLVF